MYVLSNKDYGEGITETAARKLVKEPYTDKIDLLTKMNKFVSECSEIMKSDKIYNYFEFDKYIRPTASTYREDKESICVLLDIIMKYVKEKQMTFLKGLTDFISDPIQRHLTWS